MSELSTNRRTSSPSVNSSHFHLVVVAWSWPPQFRLEARPLFRWKTPSRADGNHTGIRPQVRRVAFGCLLDLKRQGNESGAVCGLEHCSGKGRASSCGGDDEKAPLANCPRAPLTQVWPITGHRTGWRLNQGGF